MIADRLPELVRRGAGFSARLAIVDSAGTWAYADLLDRAGRLARNLLVGRADLAEGRVALLAPPGLAYAAGQWGTWMAGGVSVPLAPHQTPDEWAYILDDSGAADVIVAPEYREAIRSLADSRRIRIAGAGSLQDGARTASERVPLPDVAAGRRALMLYTSGTTSRPKGVVLTHANLAAQAECLTRAWEWRSDDRALHVLPLNHTHGVINILACALWNGAVCEFAEGFDAVRVWQRLAGGKRGGGVMGRSCGEVPSPYAGHESAPSVFMAVPTIYTRLIRAWRDAPPDVQAAWSRGAARLRLYVSGSAALPTPVFDEWRVITGHALLERYGMTEIGMALSNPLHGERRPGCVGMPLPGVDVRLVDEDGRDVGDGVPGEILVRSPGVFREYWGRPDATAAAFAGGGWFRTGDVAAREDGAFRILGRLSVDIIKTGGEKVSALEVEAVLREHPAITDCAVVGLPDAEWGECVAAVVALRDGASLSLPELRDWARARISGPKLPRHLATVPALPRNAMGKVIKPQLIQLFGA